MATGGHEGVMALKHKTRRTLRGAGPGEIGVVDHTAHALACKHDGTGLDVNAHDCSSRPNLPSTSAFSSLSTEKNCPC